MTLKEALKILQEVKILEQEGKLTPINCTKEEYMEALQTVQQYSEQTSNEEQVETDDND